VRVLVVATTLAASLTGFTVAEAQEVPDGLRYTAVGPVRVLDTRSGLGAPLSAVGPGGTITLDLAGRVPASAGSVVLTLTATAATASTYVTVSPTGGVRPEASNLNLSPGQTRPNAVTVRLGTNRRIDLYNHAGSVQLIADLAGYYAVDGAALFTSHETRVLDTRHPGQGLIGPAGTRVIDLSKVIPASATAVTANLTGVDATAPTFVTAWPHGGARPTASNLNLVPGNAYAAHAVIPVGRDRKVEVYNHAGSTHLIFDLQGFYTPDFGAEFTSVAPRRILDTRRGIGVIGGEWAPIGPGAAVLVDPETALPDYAMSAVLNVTGTDATSDTFLTAGQYTQVLYTMYSTLNLPKGDTVANLAAVSTRVDADHRFTVVNKAGKTHIVADLAGYFALPDEPCEQDCVLESVRAWEHGTGTFEFMSELWGLSDIVAVSDHLALRSDGTVRAWGDNSVGQLGNGWVGSASDTPVPVVGIDHVVEVAGTRSNRFALRDDGTVWAWGLAYWTGLGDQSDGTAKAYPVPVRIPGLSGIKHIAAGGLSAFAVAADGTVWAWGHNSDGQLGTGTSAQAWVPVQVPALKGARTIVAAGSSGMAVMADGGVMTWGLNNRGVLGRVTSCVTACPPERIPSLAGVVSASTRGAQAFAVTSDGAVWAWGDNSWGRLGTGVSCQTDCVVSSPVRTVDITTATGVVATWGGGVALLADGTVATWGELDSNSQSYRIRPVPFPDLADAWAIAPAPGLGFLALIR